nr:nucleotide-binding alpha-beta plait domain-containing protein [Tanacetum cinerariifolium]
MIRGLDMCGDVQEPVMKILTVRGWNSRSLRPILCGKLVADVQQDYDTNIHYHPGKANVVADALSRKSGIIVGIKVEEEIIRDLERLDIEIYVRGQHGYWASLRVEPDLISRIKEAQKEDSEIWTIVENLDKQVEFRLDDDNVLWQRGSVDRGSVIGWCVPDTPSHGADPSTHFIIRGSSGLQRFFRCAMFIYSLYLCYSLSLYPFTERYAQPYFFSCLIRQTQESVEANMNDKGETGFRLSDNEVQDNYRSMGVGIADKGQTIASSADKGKAVVVPSVEATTEPKATTASEELPLRIYHMNSGRSEKISNQKMKKFEFGPNGEGSTQDKVLSFNYPSATAVIISAVYQANDHGFDRLGGFSALGAKRIIPPCLLLAASIANVATHGRSALGVGDGPRHKKNMGSQRSKEDEVQKISTSVFVTNFPDQFTAKELWNTCKQYGYVVDAFIPNRRSKAGKRFGFVRFIKVFDAEHLNEEKRNHTHNVSIDKETKGPVNSYIHAVKGPQSMNMGMESNLVLVLDESCVNQQVYAYCLLGKVKEFASLTNLKVVLVSEGFDNVKLRYMGGFWAMLEFSSEEEESFFHRKRVCINTIGYFNIMESFKIIYQGKAHWVRAKGFPGWVPDFVEENDEVDKFDDESLKVEPNGDNLNNGDDVRGDSKIDEVPDTILKEKLSNTNGDESSVINKEMRSEDPFNIYDLLKTKKIDNKKGYKDTDSLKYPYGFTPRDDIEDGEVESIKRNVLVYERDKGTHNIHEEVKASGAKKSYSKKNSKGVVWNVFARAILKTQKPYI